MRSSFRLANDPPQLQNKDNDDKGPASVTDDGDYSQAGATRRSTRTTSQPERLSPKFEGKSYLQGNKKRVTFEDEKIDELDCRHDLFAQVHPNPEDDKDCDYTEALMLGLPGNS